MSDPKFSVIVPTHQRPDALARCIESLAGQSFPRSDYEIIVVDDALEPGRTAPAMTQARGVAHQLLTQKHCGAAAARNAGAAVARGRFLAFTDDDCRPAPDWLARLERRLAQSDGKTMVGGLVVNELRSNAFACATQSLVDYLYVSFNTDPESARLLTSNNLCVSADEFQRLGGFDVAFRGAGGEDRDFCLRWSDRGNRLVYAPEAIVYHAHALTLGSYLRQHVAYGRGSATLRHRVLDRGHAPIRLESPAFYWHLLRHPFRCGSNDAPLRQAFLLALSQGATCLGYLSSRLEHRIRQQRRGGNYQASRENIDD